MCSSCNLNAMLYAGVQAIPKAKKSLKAGISCIENKEVVLELINKIKEKTKCSDPKALNTVLGHLSTMVNLGDFCKYDIEALKQKCEAL